MTSRIIGIDIARAIAILLVTWKHSMASFGARDQLDGLAHYSLELLMQLATPTFLILFGAMLELVYRPRYAGRFRAETARRLYERALQCYGYYGLAILVFFVVMDTYSMQALPLVFTGFISVPYSHLLAFYTAALALSPALIGLRIKVGLAPIVGAALLIHLCHPVLHQIPMAPELFGRDYLQHMSGFLYGRGVDFIGPSLLHGMSLVCLGMLFGKGLKAKQVDGRKQISIRISVIMVGTASLLIALLWNRSMPMETLNALVGASLRIESHPLYSCVGLVGAIAITRSCIALYDLKRMTFGRSLQIFGRRSLFAFGVGNILAYIAPPSMVDIFGVWGSVFALFAVVCALTLIYDRIEQRQLGGKLWQLMKRRATA